MIITKTYITMIITMKRLLTCGMNIKVWKRLLPSTMNIIRIKYGVWKVYYNVVGVILMLP